MGNDHVLEIAGVGSIKIKIFDGSIHKIQRVQHVKGLKKNLLFIGKLHDLECETCTEDGILKVVKDALVVIKAERSR